MDLSRLNRVEVAGLAGVSRHALKYWEAGTAQPMATKLIRWALALGCEIALWPLSGGEPVT
jgi:transcriptional regulator with XRE-family HTH domain